MNTSITFRNTTALSTIIYWRDSNGQEIEYAQLQPYSSYTQPTYEGHEWLVRDRLSGLLLSETAGKAEPSTFDITENIRSVNANNPVSITFTNHTPLAVAVFWVDYQGKEQVYGKLKPGDSYAQSTFAGHPWRIRAINSGKPIGFYIPSSEAQQTCSIRLFSRQSLHPKKLEITNASFLNLQLEWIDFEGHPQPYTVIKPEGSFTQPTYASHPWILRDIHSGLVVDVLTGAFDDEALTVQADVLRSLAGVKETQVTFRSSLPFSVNLLWVDYEGNEQPYTTLLPGAVYRQSTYAAHPWRVRNTATAELVGLFIPSGEAQQMHEFVVATYQGHAAADIEIVNNSHLKTDVFLVGENAVEYKLRSLDPRERYIQHLYESARIVVRDAYSHHRLTQTVVSAESSLLTITGLSVVSEGGTPSVNVKFTNRTPFTVKIFWVDFAGKENEYATLKTGESYTQMTGARHVWRARELYTNHIVGLFIANEAAEQVANYELKSRNAHTPTSITFENDSLLTVEVLWLNYQGEEVLYKALKPGGSVGYQTYVTHPWIVRDSQSRRLLDWNWGDQQQQKITINDQDIKPREGVKEVAIAFNNKLPFAVDVLWINYQGVEQLYATLEPGEKYDQRTYETHPWRIRQQHSGDEVGLYIANGNSQQTYDISLRSESSDVATSIEFSNLSPLAVELFWLNYQGQEVSYGTLASRESKTISSYMTHPWIIRDVNSRETVGFTVGIRQPQLMNITGQTTRSRSNTKAVNLKMTNPTPLTVDVNWINHTGEEILYSSLSPGSTFNVDTYEHHSWRMREQTSQAEIDLYIASGLANQRYSIKNSLVRTRERKDAVLWQGEVALYENENFGGRVWILHDDTPSFLIAESLNDRVSSIRLGPDTAVTLFQHTHYQGINDVFHFDATSLQSSDVGDNNISSLQVLLTLPPTTASIHSTSRLTEDPTEDPLVSASGIASKPVYRSIITLPPLTHSVEVWGTEEITIKVGKQHHTIDPIRSVQLKPNAAGKLILTISPDELGKASLMLRTNSMAEKERFFVFPDIDVHTKILKMEPGTLWANRDRLGADSRFSQADLQQVQTAMQTLSNTVPAASRALSHGVSRDRLVVTDTMPYEAWSLDFGGTNRENVARFYPVDHSDLRNINANAERIDNLVGQGIFDFITEPVGKFFVETIPKAATTVVNETTDFVEDVGDTLEDAGEAIVEFGGKAIKEVEKTAVAVWQETSDWTEQAVKDTGEFIEETADTVVTGISDTAKETAEFFEDVGAALKKAAEKVVQITVEAGGKLYQFVADTVEKVGKFVQTVMEQAGILWDKFVNWAMDILGWDDVLHTHDYFVQSINNGINLAQETINDLKGTMRGWLAEAQTDVVEGIDSLIDALGAGDIAQEKRTGGLDTSDMSDKLDWITGLILDSDDDGSAATQSVSGTVVIDNPLLDKIMGQVPQSLKDELERLLTSFVDLIKEYIEDDLPIVIDSFLDSIALFQAAMQEPDRAQELVLSAVLSIVKSLAVAGLGAIDVFITMLFELFLTALELLQIALNEVIEIPVLSALYRGITQGHDLTAISLCSLVIAIPTTVMSKLITGESAFQGITVTGQSDDPLDIKKKKRSWAIAYGCFHTFLTVSDLVYDIQGGASKETSPEGRQVELGKKYKFNQRGRILKKYTNNIKRETATPAVRKQAFDIDSASNLGKGMTVFKLVTIGVGVMAQVAGNPLGHIEKLTHSELESLRQAGYNKPDYWGYIVWNFQWTYLCVGAIDFIASSLGSFSKVSTKVTDYALPALTTVVGITHIGLMSKLVDVDRKQPTKYEPSVNGRRRAGWMFDTLPAITKALTYKEVNQSTYNIPLIIHSTLFVTLGHMGEAIVYWVRAGQNINGTDFDL